MNRQFNFRIPNQLSILLKQQAEYERRTQTDLIVAAIELYLENHGAASASQTPAKPSLEFQKLTPNFDSIQALLSLADQADSSAINNLLSNHLTPSLQTPVQESISTLTSRVSVLERYLIQQVEMGRRSGSNPEPDRQQSPAQDLYLSNLEKANSLLNADFKHGSGAALANDPPLQKAPQAPRAQVTSNGHSNSLLTGHVESSSMPTAVCKLELDIASNSLQEQPQSGIDANDEWITPQAAYEHAKAMGYQRSFDAFRLSTTNKKDPANFFAQFSLGYDSTRRVSRGVTSKCFRRIEE